MPSTLDKGKAGRFHDIHSLKQAQSAAPSSLSTNLRHTGVELLLLVEPVFYSCCLCPPLDKSSSNSFTLFKSLTSIRMPFPTDFMVVSSSSGRNFVVGCALAAALESGDETFTTLYPRSTINNSFHSTRLCDSSLQQLLLLLCLNATLCILGSNRIIGTFLKQLSPPAKGYNIQNKQK